MQGDHASLISHTNAHRTVVTITRSVSGLTSGYYPG